ncbi:hypothetical protein FOE78_12650 [Microlunatus elymi]|uniref:Insertion element protein n=1 Tax=Microlunatus elymi TaxID=2596828 RepID=A0A516PZS5_9ACTN|nr:hypothetical protein [Microlunatus elymi]QDP96647.1 hypothetical protein FOE78_12650 [Microlunatus elymi]
MTSSGPAVSEPRAERQAIAYCPYCSEETLFPRAGGGWECRSCLRAFSVTFHGLLSTSQDSTAGGSTPESRDEQ